MFRRRRRNQADQPEPDLVAENSADGLEGTDGEAEDAGALAPAGDEEPQGSGPWDAGEAFPQVNRVDLGSMQIPVQPGIDVQLNAAGDQFVAVSLVRGDSILQLQAFAAPKSGGLWDDVRSEIAQEVKKAGGQSEEAAGPFGTELRARLPAEPGRRGALQPRRYLGVDGPRWLLRGLISGPAARHDEVARPLLETFAGIVVVRGGNPMPPRDLLEIQLPPEVRRQMEEQLGGQQPPGGGEDGEEGGEGSGRWEPLGPFGHGPEITETR